MHLIAHYRLPIPIQAKFISAALAAGKHILSEKPIAQDVSTASGLLQEYTTAQQQNGAQIWYIAENWRLLHAVNYAAQQVQDLGRVLGFRTRQSLMMTAESPFLGMNLIFTILSYSLTIFSLPLTLTSFRSTRLTYKLPESSHEV